MRIDSLKPFRHHTDAYGARTSRMNILLLIAVARLRITVGIHVWMGGRAIYTLCDKSPCPAP